MAFMPAGKSVFLPRRKSPAKQCAGPCALEHLAQFRGVVVETQRLAHAFGADDARSPRPPGGVDDNACLIVCPLQISFQIVFLVWVTLTEQKWLTLAERRGIVPRSITGRSIGHVLLNTK